MNGHALGERAGWVLAAAFVAFGSTTLGGDDRPPAVPLGSPTTQTGSAVVDSAVANSPVLVDRYLFGDAAGSLTSWVTGPAAALAADAFAWPSVTPTVVTRPAPVVKAAPKPLSVWWARYQGVNHVWMRADKPPFNDVRVRRAISMALDRKGMIDATYEGVGIYNPAVPMGLKDWALPVEQLGEGAQYYKFDPARSRKLLAEAGFPNGFPATISFTTYGSTIVVDQIQLILKYLKDVGIDAKLNQQEYGAYIATTFYGKYESMAFGPQTPFLDPDNFLYGPHVANELKNQSHVDDPVVTDLLVRQRR
ncbi:MAG TPA: ABC transporter substrate-binding protein, partial [Candidatus Limnocylindrales bacterium]